MKVMIEVELTMDHEDQSIILPVFNGFEICLCMTNENHLLVVVQTEGESDYASITVSGETGRAKITRQAKDNRCKSRD